MVTSFKVPSGKTVQCNSSARHELTTWAKVWSPSCQHSPLPSDGAVQHPTLSCWNCSSLQFIVWLDSKGRIFKDATAVLILLTVLPDGIFYCTSCNQSDSVIPPLNQFCQLVLLAQENMSSGKLKWNLPASTSHEFGLQNLSWSIAHNSCISNRTGECGAIW